MKVHIITTFVGCFAVEDSNIISFRAFPRNMDKISERLKLSETETIEEERELIQDLEKRGYKEIFFPFKKPGVNFIESDSRQEKFIKENLRQLAIKYKFVKDQTEFNIFLSRINIELTKSKIKSSVERDKIVIHVNGAVEELDKTLNIFLERLREIYGLHFPEMEQKIYDNEKFSRLIEHFGSREKIDTPELKQLANKSMGMDFQKDDVKAVQTFASEINRLFKLKNELNSYLEKLLREIAPNTAEISGTVLAARFISKAGGLEKLARMTSSTIQLLGSERALFRSLHSQGKISTPKYGYLVMHALVQNSPPELKGKIARVLAAKISLAAKMDYYSKKYRGDTLKRDLQERVKEILNSK
jgi:nucleolar protein 56